jgi:hypothetical protein
MTAPEKVMQKIIFMATGVQHADPATVQKTFDEMVDNDETQDAESELRGGTEVTGLPCDYSRHYESKAVAAQMLDGSWVGWTYWFGGGKHGEPEAVQWIEDAYDVEMTEVQRVVREFKRA